MFESMKFVSWIKLIPVLIHLKYWYDNTPSVGLCLPHHLCQTAPWSTENPIQYNSDHVLHRFSYFALPNMTTR